VKSGNADAPKSRGGMWEALNRDQTLYNEVMDIIEHRFWFVGILEELDLSMTVFCGLGVCGGGGGGKRRQGMRHLLSSASFSSSYKSLMVKDSEEQEENDDNERRQVNHEEEEEEEEGEVLSTGRRQLLQKHSAKPSNFKLDSISREQIANLNHLDVKLYRHCRERLHETAIKYTPEIAKKYKLL